MEPAVRVANAHPDELAAESRGGAFRGGVAVGEELSAALDQRTRLESIRPHASSDAIARLEDVDLEAFRSEGVCGCEPGQPGADHADAGQPVAQRTRWARASSFSAAASAFAACFDVLRPNAPLIDPLACQPHEPETVAAEIGGVLGIEVELDRHPLDECGVGRRALRSLQAMGDERRDDLELTNAGPDRDPHGNRCRRHHHPGHPCEPRPASERPDDGNGENDHALDVVRERLRFGFAREEAPDPRPQTSRAHP